MSPIRVGRVWGAWGGGWLVNERASGGGTEFNRFVLGDTAEARKGRTRRSKPLLRLVSSGPQFSHLENGASSGGEMENH